LLDRERARREASPSAGIIDNQSIKAPHGKTRGYNAGKKILGRKRHIAVDAGGHLLTVNLTPTDISDGAGVQLIVDAICKRWPWVKHLFAYSACNRLQRMETRRLTWLRRRDHPPPGRSEGLQGFAPSMGDEPHLRMHDPPGAPRARLRAPHRRLDGHDPRRHGREFRPKKRPSVTFRTGSKKCMFYLFLSGFVSHQGVRDIRQPLTMLHAERTVAWLDGVKAWTWYA